MSNMVHNSDDPASAIGPAAAQRIGLAMAERRANQLARKYALTEDERLELHSRLEHVALDTLAARIAASRTADEASAWVWCYMREQRGAGAYVFTILRRRHDVPLYFEREGRLVSVDVADDGADPFDIVCALEERRTALAEARARGLQRRARLARARSLLDDYLRTLPEAERRVLEGRAEGLAFLEIAAREVGSTAWSAATPTTRKRLHDRQRKRFQRAWAKVPEKHRATFGLLGLGSRRGPLDGRRVAEAA